jgi:hypothetical protein
VRRAFGVAPWARVPVSLKGRWVDTLAVTAPSAVRSKDSCALVRLGVE